MHKFCDLGTIFTQTLQQNLNYTIHSGFNKTQTNNNQIQQNMTKHVFLHQLKQPRARITRIEDLGIWEMQILYEKYTLRQVL